MWPWIVLGLLVAWVAMGTWQRYKPLPEGVGRAFPERPAEGVRFLADETWLDETGESHSHREIFDEILALIDQARRLVVLDVFLFNDFAGDVAGGSFRPLSSELTEALVRHKRRHLDLEAVVITDPLNTLYGGLELAHLERLREAGIKVVITDLTRLRASNPLWSGLWHLGPYRLGNNPQRGWLPNVLGPGRVTLRSYLAMLNFKANHRKTLVVDRGESWAGLVTSANPHDASSLHGNVALRFEGAAVLDLLASERHVAEWSGVMLPGPKPPDAAEGPTAHPRVQLLTEGAIRDGLLAAIRQSALGDRLDIVVFYLAHRDLIEGLKVAHARGVKVRVLLDLNREAFGLQKGGIPNRPVALELDQAGIPVRWCVTNGEQSHGKLLVRRPPADEGEAELILGSANFTRRNLDDLNLETSVRMRGQAETPALRDAVAFFERRWQSPPRHHSSTPVEAHGDTSPWQRLRYRVMEATGLSTF